MKTWTKEDFIREFEESDAWTCSTYYGKMDIEGRSVKVNIELENCELNKQAEFLSVTANNHLNWIAENLIDIKRHLAEKMIDLAISWSEDDLPELTKAEMALRIKLASIRISGTGEFDVNIPIQDRSITLYFNDDDIFAGHDIELVIEKGYVLDDEPSLAG